MMKNKIEIIDNNITLYKNIAQKDTKIPRIYKLLIKSPANANCKIEIIDNNKTKYKNIVQHNKIPKFQEYANYLLKVLREQTSS